MKNITLILIIALAMTAALLPANSPAQQGQSAEVLLGAALHQQEVEGNLEEAMQLIEEEPYVLMRLTASTVIHHELGNMAESDAALQTLIEEHRQVAGSYIALAYAIRGETDKVFEWLRKSVEIQGPQILMNNWYAPEFEFLHHDPRWEELLASAGLSKQQLGEIELKVNLPE